MRYNGNNFNEVIEAHKRYLKYYDEKNELGNIEDCADFSFANMSGMQLFRLDLRFANMECVNLTRAKIHNTNLSHTNMAGASIIKAKITDSSLNGTTLENCNLAYALLTNVNLEGAYIERSILTCASIIDSSLEGAIILHTAFENSELVNVNLNNATLKYSYISNCFIKDVDFESVRQRSVIFNNVEFSNVKNAPQIPSVCPDTGSFIGWKKCVKNGLVIVKLLIPEDAKRCSATSRKCRCDKAVVLEIKDMDGKDVDIAFSDYETKNRSGMSFEGVFTYKVGETVTPREPFDENRWNECSSGIHFFITREEAVNY